MNKIMVLVVAFVFVAATGFAMCGHCEGEAEGPVTKTAIAAEEFVGKVIKVTLGEPISKMDVTGPAKVVMTGTIEAVDATGKPVTFTVNTATKMVDQTLKVITLEQLPKGSKVTISASKGNVAKTVKVSE